MKIGAMSDTHGDARAMEEAFAALVAEGAGIVVHAGDIGRAGLALFGRLAERAGAKAYAALGNCDWMLEAEVAYGLAPKNVAVGWTVAFEADGKRCAVCHGHDFRRLAALAAACEIIFTGHTHAAGEGRLEGARLLSCGSAAQPRDGRRCCGLYDTATGAWRILPLGS